MKRLILAASAVAVLTACQTTKEQTDTDEVIVTATKRGPEPVVAPPPPPPTTYTGWDGAIYTDPSQIPAQPRMLTCWDGSTGPCPPEPVMMAPGSGGTQSVGFVSPSLPTDVNNEEYSEFEASGFKSVSYQPVSTFAADVDTASYSLVRRYLERGTMPPPGSVRVEEMVNYFNYDYEKPLSADKPFVASLSIVPTPWSADTQLLQIGLQGYEPPVSKRPDMNLVFLIDVSGSMQADNKLPLLKKSFEILTKQLTRDDMISIVTYASREEIALPPTRGDKTEKIMAAIQSLNASGSTAGQAGLQMAYEQAAKKFKRKGTNRIIMATDGDFNVGISDPEALKAYVEGKRDEDIYLSVLGFGQGNVKDNRMQAIAQNGNGIAAYIDSIREARKFFSDDMAKNLIPIANDLKLQVEFNPARVTEYRLIGYESRALKREDFSNDKVDAGDTGSGHSVTAIYEINPAGSKTAFVEPLRYSEDKAVTSGDFNDEYGFLKVRYKKPGEDSSQLMTMPITVDHVFNTLREAPDDTRFATAVAAFGLKLRDVRTLGDLSWDKLVDMAGKAKGDDPFGYRSEFIELVRNVEALN